MFGEFENATARAGRARASITHCRDVVLALFGAAVMPLFECNSEALLHLSELQTRRARELREDRTLLHIIRQIFLECVNGHFMKNVTLVVECPIFSLPKLE